MYGSCLQTRACRFVNKQSIVKHQGAACDSNADICVPQQYNSFLDFDKNCFNKSNINIIYASGDSIKATSVSWYSRALHFWSRNRHFLSLLKTRNVVPHPVLKSLFLTVQNHETEHTTFIRPWLFELLARYSQNYEVTWIGHEISVDEKRPRVFFKASSWDARNAFFHNTDLAQLQLHQGQQIRVVVVFHRSEASGYDALVNARSVQVVNACDLQFNIKAKWLKSNSNEV